MESTAYKKWIGGVFDRAADQYGHTTRYFDYFAGQLVRWASPPSHGCFLDVATGRGAILKHLAQSVDLSASTLIGIDLSPSMIACTTQDLGSLYPSIQLKSMDAEHLDFPDETFDAVFCGFGMFFFPYPLHVLKEFLRILKPNGRLFFSAWKGSSPLQETFMNWTKGRLIQTQIIFRHFESKDSILPMVKQAGFNHIHIIEDTLDYVYPTYDAWFQSLWTHGSRARLEQLTADQIQEAYITLKETVQEWQCEDGLHEIIQAYYVQAGKKY